MALTGDWAYKLKKPVNFGFVNFETLELRKAACEEELRLNLRTAPELYRDVVVLTDESAGPQFEGRGPVLEYAVRMRQFPQDDLLDRRIARNALSEDVIETLAHQVADLHERAPHDGHSQFGSATQIRKAVDECLDPLDDAPVPKETQTAIRALKEWTVREWERLSDPFLERQRRGRIRECHGDLHLGNIVLYENRPVLFDCIEFNPDLRWIDVFSDVAFLFMDLLHRNAPRLAWRLLNEWLQVTGDYRGLIVLKYYVVYRALVRAKVAALRLSQTNPSGADAEEQKQLLKDYVQLAFEFTKPAKPMLILMHGVSGSGKSFIGREIACSLEAIQVRSDVERKRIFKANDRSDERQTLPAKFYSSHASFRTYQRLQATARAAIRCSYPVVVDATFLRRDDRQRFLAMGKELRIPTIIVSCSAPGHVLRQRIIQRHARGRDASDADLAVLEKQLAEFEPLDSNESSVAVEVNDSSDLEAIVRSITAIAER